MRHSARDLNLPSLKSANARLVQLFPERTLLVLLSIVFECADAYDPVAYKVTDKATQPDVIGFAVAAATDALKVRLRSVHHPIGCASAGLLPQGRDCTRFPFASP